MSTAPHPFEFDEALLGSARQRRVSLTADEALGAILGTLTGNLSPVSPMASSLQFVEHYNLTFDGESLAQGLSKNGPYKHLREVYEDDHREQVLMAAAQTGKSARLMVHLARACFGDAYGKLVGYYFPDVHLPRAFSRSRFKPFLRSNPALGRQLGAAKISSLGSEEKRKGTDAILTMTLAETTVFLMTIGGKTSTEGLPLKAVYFDEVRRMLEGDIDRAKERTSAQVDPINFKVSTARYPETDIHRFFLETDQRHFHTQCGCPEGIVLSLRWPDCVLDLRSATPQLLNKVKHAFLQAGQPYLGVSPSELGKYPAAVFYCPDCGTVIADPREGWWQEHAEGWAHGYQMPQMLSPTQSAGSILDAFENMTEKQEFYNSKLGLAFVDTTKMPLQAEHVDACVRSDIVWGEQMTDSARRKRLKNCAMGIDVQAGYGICVIKAMSPNGKHRTVHLEVLEPPDPERTWWHRAGQLMDRYDVAIAVVEEVPEISQAAAFCASFPGRAYLGSVTLGDNAPRWAQWGDIQLGSDDSQKGEIAIRYRVNLKRTNALHWTVMRWKQQQNEIPAYNGRVQSIPVDKNGKAIFSRELQVGTRAPVLVGHVLRDHLTKFVFLNLLEDDPEKARQGKKKWVAEHIGSSPDFAFADMYASIALDRIGKPAGIRELA